VYVGDDGVFHFIGQFQIHEIRSVLRSNLHFHRE
jgi:hypothetical protein